jgi:hypothetical protein
MESGDTFFDCELINIDRENNNYSHIPLSGETDDLKNYILGIRDSIIEEKESRVFKITSETTQVFTAVKAVLLDSSVIQTQSGIIAKRLLRIENETRDRYKQLPDIQKGSLLVCKFPSEVIMNILLIKIEHSSFIDEADLTKHNGLPLKKEILKSCLFQFDEDANIISIIAHDSNGDISVYWWNNFLELEKVSNDIQNTVVAFDSIENVLRKNIKDKAPSDYSLLRNNLIGYFRTKTSFKLHELVEYVIGNYTPINDGINLEDIKEKILSLPTKKKFDATFTLMPKEIKAKMRNAVKINEMVELRINSYIDNFKTIIRSEMGIDGKKYIKIVADDDAYSKFDYTKE